tara:strand:- start:1245 stop:2456 length:1212 start_codon:yes stop_codon:yes gene_type:complete
MSFFFTNSNKDTAINLFRKRLTYRGEAAKEGADYQNFMDFNFAEKFLYGRVDRTFVPITFTGGFTPLKNFKSAFSKTDGLQAANFVVDAFEEMTQEFERCSLSGQISPNDPFLSKLRVFKAHTSSERVYGEYIEKHFNAIAIQFKDSNIRIKNFDEFIKEFMLLLQKSAYTIPFTQTAFTKSKYCPLLANGLSIEIADLDGANDDQKIIDFFNSMNWKFYLNVCRSYGFMVDRMVPWRLVADIGSSTMLKYASKYGAGNTNIILKGSYRATHDICYNKFKYLLLSLYNKVTLKNFIETEECNGQVIMKVVKPQKYTKRQFENKYSEEYFLNLYCKIRFLEEESQFENYEKNILIDDTIEYYQAKGINPALDKIERIINKPFDYRGSLSYYSIYAQARREAEEP